MIRRGMMLVLVLVLTILATTAYADEVKPENISWQSVSS